MNSLQKGINMLTKQAAKMDKKDERLPGIKSAIKRLEWLQRQIGFEEDKKVSDMFNPTNKDLWLKEQTYKKYRSKTKR